jgi:hypothetical protein
MVIPKHNGNNRGKFREEKGRRKTIIEEQESERVRRKKVQVRKEI